MPGIFKAYPFLDDCNRILWPAKYPNAKAIKEIEAGLPKPQKFDLYTIFSREYLLDMSCIYTDEMMQKHRTPIRAGGKSAKGFEISALMWAIGTVWYFPESKKKSDLTLSVDDRDGYPLEKYIKIEEEQIKRKKAENPHYVERVKSNSPDPTRFIDHPDRPVRYRE